MENKVSILTTEFYTPVKDEFLNYGLDEGTFRKEASFAIQHLKNSAYLQGCTPNSILTAVLNIAQIGLTLNPVAKQAYLVPRSVKVGNSWERRCFLDPSYIGLVKLLTDTGSVKTVKCNVVYSNDFFEIIQGTTDSIIHKPALSDRGEIIGAYAIAMLEGGLTQSEWMDIAAIDEIMNLSESYKSYKSGDSKSCIWVTNKPEMCRKTVIKRVYKYLPKSETAAKVEKAIDLDHEANGIAFPASHGQGMMIESLLRNTSIGDEEVVAIEREILSDDFSQRRASELIEYLQDHQLDRIASGSNYNQGDIQKHLKKIIQ